MTLGEKIKHIRRIRNIERKEIAARLDITVQQYGNIENGDTPADKYLPQIAEIFKVDREFIENFDAEFILNQTNNYENSVGYGYVQNLYQQNNDLLEKVAESEKKITENEKRIIQLEQKIIENQEKILKFFQKEKEE